MDFVDLDKVLDQFEEEEKAAEEILPGQETKPSGYAEYLVSHQDRPWESLSLGQPADANTKQLALHSQAVVYDDPYDSYDKLSVEGHTDLKQLGFPAKNSYVDHQVNQDTHSLGHSLSHEQDLVQAKLKEEKIEAYLPPLHLSNGVGKVTGLDLNGWVDGMKGEDGERRGLIASQPASIQTDTLSPASERELLSYPLPKSDILVEGHGQTQRNTPPLPAYTTAPCHSANMEPTTNYASSNGIGTSPVSTEQLPQGSEDAVQHPNTEVDSSHTSEHQIAGMERDAACVPDAETSSCSGKETNITASEPSAKVRADLQPSEKPVDQQGTGISLKQEIAASVGEGIENRVAEEAVGFETEECEMDKDEVDAYLEELESGLLADGGDMSGQTASCETPQAVVTSGGDSLEKDMVTTAAVIHPSVDSSDDMSHMASVQASDGSLDGIAGESDGVESQVVDIVSNVDNGDDMVHGGVADHSANVDGTTVVGEPANERSIRDNCPDLQHPQVVIGQPDTRVRTDRHPEYSMEMEEENRDITNMNVNADGSAGKTSLGLSDVNKTEVNSGMNLNRCVDTSSLEFPVAGNKNGVSSVVKGKLEIEGLLDEIVAARLAEKSSGLISAEPSLHGQLAVEQTLPRDSDGSEKSRTEGWGPEGSMVCSRVRETSSASPEMASPAQSGSPSPTLGIGARPKDPSHMKKNRPNSLLGLSKISLTSPFSPPQQQTSGPVVEVMLPATHQVPSGTEFTDANRECRTQNHSMGGRQLGVSPPPVGVPPPEDGAVLPMDGAPAPSAMEPLVDEGVETLVMRRPDMRDDAGIMGEGEEASSGMHRPQSWSPSTLSSPPTQRTKRPTSLNLPVRQDRMGSLSPDGDNSRSRKAGVMGESGGSSEAGSSEEENMGIGGTDGCPSGDMSIRDPQQEQEGAAAAAELPLEAPPPSILHLNLGKIAPTWLPDADAPACMECAARFTFTKRRHHCRACGKIFCSTCCGQKSRLTYLENKEGRVCVSCHHILSSAHCVRPAGVSCRSPNPNNPIEYCSTVPPTQQANARAPLPTVMVPTGVLKRHGEFPLCLPSLRRAADTTT